MCIAYFRFINHRVENELHIVAEYFMYSHLPYFLHIVAMLCYSEDVEFFDEDFF
jgi:hypothetical protein